MIGLINPVQSVRALLPKQHIFLLSHMRAYTSLFGHIMGSNPAICGYYEMHMGYHSWRSLVRQKLLYFRAEDIKPGLSYMFDKVLHDDHHVNPTILAHPRCRFLVSLRRPEDTIPSIIKMYAKTDPTHEFTSEAFATSYYVNRLATLERIARDMRGGFFYFDAESLKSETSRCLTALGDWLELEFPLSSHYAIQKKTSRERYGDTSGTLDAGEVVARPSAYRDYEFDPERLSTAQLCYEKAREHLVALSDRCCTLPPQNT